MGIRSVKVSNLKELDLEKFSDDDYLYVVTKEGSRKLTIGNLKQFILKQIKLAVDDVFKGSKASITDIKSAISKLYKKLGGEVNPDAAEGGE